MLIGYEANIAMRDSQTLGDYSRELIEKLSNRHIRDGYRALLFSTRIKNAYRSYFSGNSNVSTYLPTGFSKTLPSAWIRYHLNPWLKSEKGGVLGSRIKWNFTKFLIDRNGRVADRFAPTDTPEKLEAKIRELI